MKKTIKILAFILIAYLGQYPFNSIAQKITYKNTSINISSDAFSTISGDIRYKIESDFLDSDTLAKLFPDKVFNLQDGKLVYGSLINYNNMWQTCDIVKIEQEDVNKTVNQLAKQWTVNIIYNANLLNIDTVFWKIK